MQIMIWRGLFFRLLCKIEKCNFLVVVVVLTCTYMSLLLTKSNIFILWFLLWLFCLLEFCFVCLSVKIPPEKNTRSENFSMFLLTYDNRDVLPSIGCRDIIIITLVCYVAPS